MRSTLRMALVSGTVAMSLTAAAFAQAAGPDEERAERREEARSVVAAALQERSVRPVAADVMEREARSIVRSLSDEQVEDLLSGKELEAVRPRTVAAAVTAGEEPESVTAQALGDAESDLLFVPVEPCRIIDTRLAGGLLAAGAVRHFEVAGTANFESQGGKAGGCGVPLGASTPLAAAVVINVIAVGPQGPGHLRAWEFSQAPPNASIINYANVGGLNIANGVVLPIAGVSSLDKDLSIDANVSSTFIVADVTGYFTRFPIEQFQGGLKSTVITTQNTTLTSMADGGCKELNTCTVTAGSAGTVIVEAWGQFVASHTAGTLDRVAIGVETTNPVVCNADDTVDVSDFEVSAALGSNPDVDFTVSHGRAFTVAAGQTRTYRLSGQMINGANAGDAIENSRMICTFIPD
jgi:hypothetical protein